MPRLISKLVLMCAAVWLVSGCSSADSPLLEKETYTSMFSNTTRMFDVSDFMKSDRHEDDVSLGPSGPVKPEDLVTADGRCASPTVAAPEPEAAPTPAPPADRPVGSIAGDLAGAPMAAAPAATQIAGPPPDRLQPEGLPVGTSGPPVMGGVALGMTECQVVRRAGVPSNVSIGATSADGKGERKVVLTYDGGSWPGVYRFTAGRLQVIEGLPQTQTAKSKSKSRPATKRSARQSAGRIYVQ